ncbi:choice-of-anchor J domain-containing protein [Flavobacterium paronense]|uniref:T9SS-dependent choice-of-anchor J family protein n=1 Tax=Flavobacterium paronense TaxID=1392775 RepID=A0ABV5GCB7_9FLAO|nr:choice-of-anchor J domain-containing protein [Flavobacterium paronense]MDN3677855.1 choice-of-anchor J domain-containing protein [Flavobacterium paronense]
MKKITILLLLFISSIKSYSQSIFEENFETTTDLLASGWVIYNDDHTLNNGYDSIFTNAWEIVEWAEETPNKAASTSSAFIEAGPADRWLVSPAIAIPSNATNTLLTFKARCFDIFPRQDGFKLKIATTNNLKNSFTTNLLSVPNTPNTLLINTAKTSVNLSTYAGQTIYLAWVDDFENGNILAIDDIDISANSLSVIGINANKFSIYPNPSNGTFKIDTINQISKIEIFDVLGKLVYTGDYSTNVINATTSISKGIYILKATFENNTSDNQKIIIE